jgi:hypothetical protein
VDDGGFITAKPGQLYSARFQGLINKVVQMQN